MKWTETSLKIYQQRLFSRVLNMIQFTTDYKLKMTSLVFVTPRLINQQYNGCIVLKPSRIVYPY
jgi:hypothetical protein